MTRLTSQVEVRKAFWAAHPTLPRKLIRNYAGTGKMHQTDVRCAFVDFIDYLERSNQISTALARRVTLGSKS